MGAELAFGKIGSEWRIHLVPRGGGARGRQELLSASRGDRAKACVALPRLLEELLSNTDRELEAVRDATLTVDALLKEMTGGEPPL